MFSLRSSDSNLTWLFLLQSETLNPLKTRWTSAGLTQVLILLAADLLNHFVLFHFYFSFISFGLKLNRICTCLVLIKIWFILDLTNLFSRESKTGPLQIRGAQSLVQMTPDTGHVLTRPGLD